MGTIDRGSSEVGLRLVEQVQLQVEVQAKYSGYIDRQQEEIERQRRHETTRLPDDIDYGDVRGLSSDLANPKSPLGWRQMTKYSGFNMLTLGILYETVLRWVAPASRVFAYASKHIGRRIDPETNEPAKVGTPDSVQVLTTQSDGSCGVYRLSGVILHDTGMSINLYGSRGTLIYGEVPGPPRFVPAALLRPDDPLPEAGCELV